MIGIEWFRVIEIKWPPKVLKTLGGLILVLSNGILSLFSSYSLRKNCSIQRMNTISKLCGIFLVFCQGLFKKTEGLPNMKFSPKMPL